MTTEYQREKSSYVRAVRGYRSRVDTQAGTRETYVRTQIHTHVCPIGSMPARGREKERENVIRSGYVLMESLCRGYWYTHQSSSADGKERSIRKSERRWIYTTGMRRCVCHMQIAALYIMTRDGDFCGY